MSRFDAEVSATRMRMQSVAALLTAVVQSQPENHPGHGDQKSHAGGRGSEDEFFDNVDQFGNATLDGQVYNDQDLSTGTRLTPEYLDQFGRPAHETFYGDPGKGFSVVLSERGEFHIAADRVDKLPRPGLDKRDQGLGNVRGPEDVVASGISRDGLASLASDARSASEMNAPDGSHVNAATGITVTSRNGGDNVSLSLNGRSLGDVAGYVDELDASVAGYDAGAHRGARNIGRRIFAHPGHGDQKSHAGGKDSVELARERQAAIDVAKGHGTASSKLDELANNEVSAKTIRHTADRFEREGTLTKAEADTVRTAADGPDYDTLRSVSDNVAARSGLTPIGRAGDVVAFNPRAHQLIDDGPHPTRVEIVRRGHDFDYQGESIRIARAVVEPV